MGGLQGPFRGVLCLPSVFGARLRAAASRAQSLPAPDASPQHAIDETNPTQAGGGVVSQKVAKFTAEDFTA